MDSGMGKSSGNSMKREPPMAELYALKKRLDHIDAQLTKHRGPASPQQADLLRLRRECLLEMKDAERAFWGE